MPVATASCPVDRWQNPRIFFSLYRRSAAISIRLRHSVRKTPSNSLYPNIPYSDHVVVHLLELILGRVESIWGRVELVGFEALIGKLDLEWLVIFLWAPLELNIVQLATKELTVGTLSLSACADAASVVTNRATGLDRTLLLTGSLPAGLKALVNMATSDAEAVER